MYIIYRYYILVPGICYGPGVYEHEQAPNHFFTTTAKGTHEKLRQYLAQVGLTKIYGGSCLIRSSELFLREKSRNTCNADPIRADRTGHTYHTSHTYHTYPTDHAGNTDLTYHTNCTYHISYSSYRSCRSYRSHGSYISHPASKAYSRSCR